MALLPFSPFSIFPSPHSSQSVNEISLHKCNNNSHMHLDLRLVFHTNSCNLSLYFYGRRRTLTSTGVIATVKQCPMNQVKKKREFPVGLNTYGNQNQSGQTNTLKQSNVFLWNDMIRDYVQNGFFRKALRIYYQMQSTGIEPDRSVFISLINACGSLSDLQAGMQIHQDIIARGFESDVCVGTTLASMYIKCGSLEKARQVFDRLPERHVVSWNTMIAAYSQNDHPHESLAFFIEMQAHGIKPNAITITCLLPACADLFALELGKQIHGYVIRNGFEFDVVLGNALVDMYAKCENIDIAHKLFERMPKRDVVSWNAIIAGHAKCGNVDIAHKLLERMPQRNIVSWTTIISCCSQNRHPREALAFFNEMQVQGVKPNSITMASVLPACADLLALKQGKQIHGYVIRRGSQYNVFVCNGLVDMYAKCGHICIARQVFDKMSNQNVVLWNALILGYGLHGHGEEVLALFSQMQQRGIKPDHITFIGVLTACSHGGLIDEGWKYFECMKSDYDLSPKLEHYACLVDLLGRAGRLDAAYDIVKKMPLEPDDVVWGALLGACRIHGNIELGELAAKHLFELEPNNAGYYVLLSNIYAEAGRWEDVSKLRIMMKGREMKKEPGYSYIEVNREGHTFLMGDRTHPQSEKIYAMLETLYGQMEEVGYVPNTNLVLLDVEQEVKENMLCRHSEKVAIAFGIINTSPGTSIYIMKNLRVCSDCHIATKFISKIVGREIILRDANRFHHFNSGLCSCGDYW